VNGEQFERAVAEWLQGEGFKTSLTQQSSDRGIDVIAQKQGATYAVQAKAYSSGNKVGSSTIQKVSGLLSRPDIDGAIVITTSSFTSEAEAVANNRGVELVTTDNDQSARSQRKTAAQSSSNEDFHSDPRVQYHQEEAGISPVEDDDNNNPAEKFRGSINCPNCGTEISGRKQKFVSHWQSCKLPSERPSDVPVDIWWDVKDKIQ